MNNLTRLLELVNESDDTRAKVLGEIIRELIKQRDEWANITPLTPDHLVRCMKNDERDLEKLAARYFEGER